ncbi:cellulose synthase (UDP-forming) [Devosia lucknowensis]|uniref:Cellulose synthase catalytic subunit [UDP-forming] n=1 Tax=Devosia lucknowensis TaxID=1096929 RepID=A0A1Y6EJ05_9HYPH|nr:UDP-forming cellulose synthase catalytic subunit [Devosia lucknowensis]SMQ60133.1 cellulose synthase (UDP-forming) [Devosia lucknowensis]
MRKFISLVFWLGVAALAAVTITMPVSIQAHLVTSLLLLVLMMLIKVFKLSGTWRLMLLAFGTAIILRYAFWRTTSTIPPVTQIADFIPGFLLYLAEMYSVLMLGLSLFVVSSPLPPRPSTSLKPDDDVPHVDAFVPTYNEDEGLLAGTLAAAKAMDYPADKLTVWLLDDGGTLQKRQAESLDQAVAAQHRHERLQKLAEELGCNYLTRDRNEHAKAGNLNNGLAHSKGELVAVFDADHAPARDFLQQTVPYFAKDHRLFLVQTPHFFLNPDPLERNLQTFETMPSENEMFYGVIQRGLDKWNASFFCGSAAVLRRTALETTNGFAGRSITEDAETAIDLHGKGWNSIYVDRPLIAGLQPATFASFIGQRTRWAQGMLQIMLMKFPLFKRGLSFGQRMSYLSSTMFWLFPISRMIFLFAPFFYLFFDLQIFTASSGEFVAYTVTYMLANLVIQNSLFGRWRWPLISELYEYIQSVHLFPALLSVMLNPSKPTFNVTSKDETTVRSRVSEIGMPFYIIFFLLLVGLGFTIFRLYAEPFKAEITLVVGGWNLFNLLIAGCALGVVSERREARQNRRVPVDRACQVRTQDGTWVDGTIMDVSSTGMSVKLRSNRSGISKDTMTGLRFTPYSKIEEPEMTVDIRNAVMGENGTVLGCQYVLKTANDYRLMADLLYANSAQWTERLNSKRANIGIIEGLARFLWIALYQTSRGLAYLVKFGQTPAVKSTRNRRASA